MAAVNDLSKARYRIIFKRKTIYSTLAYKRKIIGKSGKSKLIFKQVPDIPKL